MGRTGKADSPLPILFQINVSPGGLPKLPVPKAWVSFSGLEGDRQRNRVVHGGPDRAVCLYAKEKITALQQEGHTIGPGAAGENLTLAGLAWDQMAPGDLVHVGHEVQLEITSFCEPCRHNAQWFVDGNFHRISHAHHPGWSRLYARVLTEGWVYQGDPVRLGAQALEAM